MNNLPDDDEPILSLFERAKRDESDARNQLMTRILDLAMSMARRQLRRRSLPPATTSTIASDVYFKEVCGCHGTIAREVQMIGVVLAWPCPESRRLSGAQVSLNISGHRGPSSDNTRGGEQNPIRLDMWFVGLALPLVSRNALLSHTVDPQVANPLLTKDAPCDPASSSLVRQSSLLRRRSEPQHFKPNPRQRPSQRRRRG